MTTEMDWLPRGGTGEGLFISPKGIAAREYLNARREVKFDVEHTALISLHLQKSAVTLTGVPDEMMDRIAIVLKGARQAGIYVTHQIHCYRQGYPEANPRNKTLRNMMSTGVLQRGMESAEIHAKAAPLPNEPVVGGPRISAFADNDMGAVLRAKDITSVVLLGVSTSGSVMGSMASAADLDYDITMLEDCCCDTDPEMHAMMFERLFPRRATIMTAQEFLQAIGAA